MPTVLITGANRGLGLEFARQYKADRWDVIATARTSSPELDALGVRVEALDMSDLEAVAAFSAVPERLDLFIANAGTYGPRDAARKSYASLAGRGCRRILEPRDRSRSEGDDATGGPVLGRSLRPGRGPVRLPLVDRRSGRAEAGLSPVLLRRQEPSYLPRVQELGSCLRRSTVHHGTRLPE